MRLSQQTRSPPEDVRGRIWLAFAERGLRMREIKSRVQGFVRDERRM
jgi:hypothetical protein